MMYKPSVIDVVNCVKEYAADARRITSPADLLYSETVRSIYSSRLRDCLNSIDAHPLTEKDIKTIDETISVFKDIAKLSSLKVESDLPTMNLDFTVLEISLDRIHEEQSKGRN